MRTQFTRSAMAIAAAAAGTAFLLAGTATVGQAQAPRLPRTADGKPNLNGIWQANNTANWDLEAHAARRGPVIALGAAFAVPAGLSVVEGGTIPYRPAMLAKKKEDRWDSMTVVLYELSKWEKKDTIMRVRQLGPIKPREGPKS